MQISESLLTADLIRDNPVMSETLRDTDRSEATAMRGFLKPIVDFEGAARNLPMQLVYRFVYSAADARKRSQRSARCATSKRNLEWSYADWKEQRKIREYCTFSIEILEVTRCSSCTLYTVKKAGRYGGLNNIHRTLTKCRNSESVLSTPP